MSPCELGAAICISRSSTLVNTVWLWKHTPHTSQHNPHTTCTPITSPSPLLFAVKSLKQFVTGEGSRQTLSFMRKAVMPTQRITGMQPCVISSLWAAPCIEDVIHLSKWVLKSILDTDCVIERLQYPSCLDVAILSSCVGGDYVLHLDTCEACSPNTGNQMTHRVFS